MILALLILLGFQLLGELFVQALGLLIPGPVMGMVFFFLSLVAWPKLKERVAELSKFITTHLGLFFVPAGVGLMNYFGLFEKYSWMIVLTLILSTLITLAITAWVFHLLLPKGAKEGARD